MKKEPSRSNAALNENEASPTEAERLLASAGLRAAAEAGDLDAMREFVAQGAREVPDSHGETALMLAAHNGHAKCARELLPLSDANARSGRFNNHTPLMMAAAEGHLDCVRILAPKTQPAARDKTGGSALSMAAMFGYPEIVKALLPFSDARQKDHSGCSALWWATTSEDDNTECIEVLIPVSDVNESTRDKDFPLGTAAANGNSGIVKALLAAEADALKVDADGNSALMKAILTGHVDAARALLAVSDFSQRTHKSGLTPLILAAMQSDPIFVDLILPFSDSRARSHLGFTAFEQAVRCECWNCADRLWGGEPEEKTQAAFEKAGGKKMPRWAAAIEARELSEEIGATKNSGFMPRKTPRAL